MKKLKKTLLICLAISGLSGLLWVGNAFLGNPVSRALAVRAADQHLQEHYPNTDYQILRVAYTFKTTSYYAYVESPSSMDTHFTIYFDMLGNAKYDTYDSVEDDWNTARRLDSEYRKLTDQVFNDPELPYDNSSIYSILFGELEIYPLEFIQDPNISDIPDYALVQDDLVLDQAYDIRELGALAGHLVIYVDSEELTPEAAAAIMLDFKARFDQANIPFYAMDMTLRHPIREDGTREPGDFIILDFPYSEMNKEGLAERLLQAHKAATAYYDALDDK